jgi:hypothetical protein
MVGVKLFRVPHVSHTTVVSVFGLVNRHHLHELFKLIFDVHLVLHDRFQDWWLIIVWIMSKKYHNLEIFGLHLCVPDFLMLPSFQRIHHDQLI